MNTQPNILDYQQCVQNAALTFLERHQAEHLGDTRALHRRVIDHLIDRFNVSETVADKLTALAHTELVDIARRKRPANP
ncbi:hypothetical protein ACQ9Y2_20390 [Pseudomonas palleroniana]